MFPSFIHSKKLIRYKNNLFKKWAMYWKNLYTDYANVGITTYQDCVANPLRSSLTLTTAWGVYYIKSHNPDELSYRSAIINANNYFTLISSTARNPSTTEYLTIINKSLSQGLARYFSCGLFSIVWIDEFDDIVSVYKQQCRYLKISWIALPGKIVDIGFLNRWWILEQKMVNCDVNHWEFEKKADKNAANFQFINY